MSEKFNAKNLTYNKALPPFLAALKSQHASPAAGPNPLLAGNRRHGAKRSGSAEAEDAPLVVDADGNVVDAKLEADGTVRYGDGDDGDGDGADVKEAEKEDEGTKAVPIVRKRKAKVVGAGQEDEEEAPAEKGPGEENDKAKKSKEPAENGPDVKKNTKGKKKAKKIKLSFDEDA
ncbi:hypothetical protein VUR80DRAFT_8978 [Thermomyces stellatus]